MAAAWRQRKLASGAGESGMAAASCVIEIIERIGENHVAAAAKRQRRGVALRSGEKNSSKIMAGMAAAA